MSDTPQNPAVPGPALRVLEPGTLVGRFQVEALLGRGGMGEVYKAWDPTLERSVALKALHPREACDPGSLERFRREALVLAQLNHPNVCQVHDWVDAPEGSFIAMELVEGLTLDQAAPTLQLKDKLYVLQGVAQALEIAHAKGIVHRDLKPGNIMVVPAQGGRRLLVKVLDFGLARLVDPRGLPESGTAPAGGVPNFALLQALDEAEKSQELGDQLTAQSKNVTRGPVDSQASSRHTWDRLTQVGTFMGSPRYASPEQLQGQAAGSSSDIFSLGIVAWELLSGEHPYPGEDRSRMRAILEGKRSELKVRGLPSGTAELLKGMLETHPFKRPTSSKVSETLERLLKPHSLLRWVSISVLSALLLAGGTNWLLSRGVISDLTKKRPARVAVFPIVNGTGDPKLDTIARIILPEMLESALRESTKLSPLDADTMAKAQAALHLPPGAALSPADQVRLASALGSKLLLRGSLTRDKDNMVVLHYELKDATGKLRQAGEAREPIQGEAIQALVMKAAGDLLRATDPFGSHNRARTGVPPALLEAYARGRELLDHGAFKEAAPAFQAVAMAAPDYVPAILAYARCLERLADAPSEPVIQWARWAARAQGNRQAELTALHLLAIRLGSRGQWEAADRATQEALTLARTLGAASEAGIHTTLGVNLQRRHRLPEAEAEYKLALSGFQSVEDRVGSSMVLIDLAVVERERGNLKGAESHYLEALEVVRSNGDKWSESVITNNLGDLALAQEGGLDRAEELFKKAKSLSEVIGDQNGLVYTLMGLASVYQSRGDIDRAEALVHQYLDLARKASLRPMEALALYNLGELARSVGRFESARAYYLQSLGLHEEFKDTVMQAYCLAGVAECHAREGHRTPARNLMERSQALSTEESPYILRAQAWLARGEGRGPEATALFTKALASAKVQAPEIVRELKEALR